MLVNSNATIYNSYYDSTTEEIKYKRTYLYGVNWQVTKALEIDNKGVITANVLSVFVPSSVLAGGSVFIDAKEFERLENKNGYYTFKTNDIIVKGLINFDITGERGHTVKDLFNNFTEVFTIKPVADNRKLNIGHWEIGGV